VVVYLDGHSDLEQAHGDLAAHILQTVHRWDGEVASLRRYLRPQVRPAVRLAAVPPPLGAIDMIVLRVRGSAVAHVVEQEELGLRAPVGCFGDASLLQVLLGLAGHVAAVSRVRLPCDRVKDITDQVGRRHLEHRIHEGCGRVGYQDHIRLVDLLKSADGRAIKADSFVEDAVGQFARRDAEVMPLAKQVGEAQVHHLHLGRQSAHIVRRGAARRQD